MPAVMTSPLPPSALGLERPAVLVAWTATALRLLIAGVWCGRRYPS